MAPTFSSSEFQHIIPTDSSVAGEENGISIWSRHHYLGKVPLIFWEKQEWIFLHLDQQKFPQR